MRFPEKAIFAFNANLDHVKSAGEEDAAALDKAYPSIASQMSECFAYGVQKEVQIDARQCDFFLSSFKYSATVVGGQAGNAAQQASSLGVKCYLHTSFPEQKLLSLFSNPQSVLVAGETGFVPANKFSPEAKPAHHFVFENAESRTRFIASFDPVPVRPEDSFCRAIDAELPGIKKAFVGGLHLAKSPDRARKLIAEVARWKQINPSLSVFLELGEFSSLAVLEAVRKEAFPLSDFVGLNEVELSQLGSQPEELAGEVLCVLLHTSDSQQVFPEDKKNEAALDFARRCASFLAAKGRFASAEEAAAFPPSPVVSPVRTVGLGDALSCAYFMALP